MSGHADLATVLDELAAAQARVRLLEKRIAEMTACAHEASELLDRLFPSAGSTDGDDGRIVRLVSAVTLIGRQA